MKKLKIGLALGGGGARGLAHLGVLRALEEQSVEINYLAGVSMGAILAAGYGHKKNLARLLEATEKFDYSEYIRPYNKRILINQEKVIAYFNKYLENSSFEDFAIPVSVVTTDFKEGRSFIIDKGKVAIAIAASSTAPYIHQPVKYKGRLLVDGGLVSNVPVDLVERMGADMIIGVDVRKQVSLVDKFHLNNSQKKILARLPFASLIWQRQLTNFLRHSNQVVSNELETLRLFSLSKPLIMIKPDLGDITSLSFDRKEEAIEAGYLAAKQELKKYKTLAQDSELSVA